VILAHYAINGDQVHYIKIYNAIAGKSIIDAYAYYILSIDSAEFVHFFFTWIFSTVGLEKFWFVSVFNAILAYISASLFVKLNASKAIGFVIITTSFYFNVLYFSAERLKFGFLLLFVAMLYVNRPRIFGLMLFASVLAHAQMVISFGSLVFNKVMGIVERVIRSGYLSRSFLMLIIAGALIALILGDHIAHKVIASAKSLKLGDLFKISSVLLLAVFYAKDKKQACYVFVPIVFAVLIVGSDRVMMMGYFFFLYYGLKVNRGYNLGVILTTIYFSYKSLNYLYLIVNYGDGFYKHGGFFGM